jgi:hypothetical protein
MFKADEKEQCDKLAWKCMGLRGREHLAGFIPRTHATFATHKDKLQVIAGSRTH